MVGKKCESIFVVFNVLFCHEIFMRLTTHVFVVFGISYIKLVKWVVLMYSFGDCYEKPHRHKSVETLRRKEVSAANMGACMVDNLYVQTMLCGINYKPWQCG